MLEIENLEAWKEKLKDQEGLRTQEEVESQEDLEDLEDQKSLEDQGLKRLEEKHIMMVLLVLNPIL